MDETLIAASAGELQARIASGEVAPLEVMDAVLARIERVQPQLNCFITVCADEARDAARKAGERLAGGEAPRPLEGVPFTAKDLVDTAGVRTTYGSLIHAEHVPSKDAEAVARLRAAGAILVAKTTTPEFGHKAFTDAPLFGRTCNAWDRGRTCGGSSGGAAAAVASGCAPLAVASDGGGSTRIPAACNGVVGIKQSAGVVPHSRTPDPFGNYTYVTPTTRNVADTLLMLRVLCGPHPSDPWSYAPAQDFVSTDVRPAHGLRVALVERMGNQLVAREVLAALHRCAGLLEAAGALVTPVDLGAPPIEPLWRVINHSTWRARFAGLLERHRERMSPTLVRQVEMAGAYSAVDFQEAAFARGALFRQAQGWFDTRDLLLMPTVARSALPIDSNLFDPVEIDGHPAGEVRASWFPYTMPWNLTGHPAVSLPCGRDEAGLPLAVQLIGPLHHDAEVLRTAAALESALGGAPPLATP